MRLSELDKEIIGNQLKNLYVAIENLSNKKYVEDKFAFQIDDLEKKYQNLINEKNVADVEIKTLIHDRDRLRSDLKEMINSRLNLLKEKEAFVKYSKDKITTLETDLAQKVSQLILKEDEYSKLDRTFKMMCNERDKLRERFKRLK